MRVVEQNEKRTETIYLQLLLGLAICAVIGGAVFGMIVLQKLERVVVVAENLNSTVNRAAQAAAPLGRAAIERGIDAVEKVDTDALGKSATEGVKEIGRAAKDKVIEHIKKKAQEGADL